MASEAVLQEMTVRLSLNGPRKQGISLASLVFSWLQEFAFPTAAPETVRTGTVVGE
jgi:hypothetical protein